MLILYKKNKTYVYELNFINKTSRIFTRNKSLLKDIQHFFYCFTSLIIYGKDIETSFILFFILFFWSYYEEFSTAFGEWTNLLREFAWVPQRETSLWTVIFSILKARTWSEKPLTTHANPKWYRKAIINDKDHRYTVSCYKNVGTILLVGESILYHPCAIIIKTISIYKLTK